MVAPVFRLFAFLITGFWPSRASLQALDKRVSTLELRVTTLTKKHNTLAGSYYAEFELEEPSRGAASSSSPSSSPAIAGTADDDFPEDAFLEQVNARQNLIGRITGNGTDHPAR